MFKSHNIESLLHAFYEELEKILKKIFSRHIVKISQSNGSFYVFIRKQREKNLNKDLRKLFRQVKTKKIKIENFIINFFLILNLFDATEDTNTIFYLLKKTALNKKMNSISAEGSFRVELHETASFYFCEHFYRAFKEKKRTLKTRILFASLNFKK